MGLAELVAHVTGVSQLLREVLVRHEPGPYRRVGADGGSVSVLLDHQQYRSLLFVRRLLV